ncbi:Clp protease ClpS [Candidatus Viridilinea mediisalina]|uniref:ATP-dependent Clp protease adapter protein ClpS n=1 Tax=Candidatus Viridilinea mediisalina TaxID=2024553 RepID=A0A2A6RNN7_9CHLR|nr:ATP-dependent Clp protease adaptor ClpS [Candidatus Viridilinea mediisalina]PDW04545.1 Clp protease ClpS [Candidatus Viridilinea mediisalina]
MTVPEPEVTVTPTVIFKVAEREDLEKPYRVIVQNDDVTPMDFVVMVLRVFFGLAINQAMRVMLTAHNEGRALVTALPYEEAQERVYQAHHAAREAGYPLTFYLEPDE